MSQSLAELRRSYARLAGVNETKEPFLDDVLEVLRAAFPPAPIDARSAFARWGRLYCDAAEYQRRMHLEIWPELDPAFFTRRIDGLSFLNTPALIAVLPLYLALLIALGPTSPVPDTLFGQLTKPHVSDRRRPVLLTATELFDLEQQRFDELIAALSPHQASAIAFVLQRYIAQTGDEVDAQRALDRYWLSVSNSARTAG